MAAAASVGSRRTKRAKATPTSPSTFLAGAGLDFLEVPRDTEEVEDAEDGGELDVDDLIAVDDSLDEVHTEVLDEDDSSDRDDDDGTGQPSDGLKNAPLSFDVAVFPRRTRGGLA